MALRRMFSLHIVDTDAFLEMPQSTQLLYFHLSMRGDDEGFVGNPKKIMKMTGCGDDDLKILFAKNFIIGFETGIIVIKHWKLHNYIQADRFHDTNYTDEKKQLEIKENGVYTKCIQTVSTLDTQVRLGKGSLGKVREDNIYIEHFEKFWKAYPRKLGKKQAEKHFMVNIKTEEQLNILRKALTNYLKYIKVTEKQEEYILHGSTFMNRYMDWVDYDFSKTENNNPNIQQQVEKERQKEIFLNRKFTSSDMLEIAKKYTDIGVEEAKKIFEKSKKEEAEIKFK